MTKQKIHHLRTFFVFTNRLGPRPYEEEILKRHAINQPLTSEMGGQLNAHADDPCHALHLKVPTTFVPLVSYDVRKSP